MLSAIMNGSKGIKIAAAAVVLIVILLIITLILALILKKKKESPGISDKLPLGAMTFMTDEEAVLYDRLKAALRYFDGFAIYPKVSTNAILAARRDIHPKILKKLEQDFIADAHDFAIVNRSRKPVAVIELHSNRDDKREEQAYRSGLPVIRIDDPYIDPEQIANRIRPLMK